MLYRLSAITTVTLTDLDNAVINSGTEIELLEPFGAYSSDDLRKSDVIESSITGGTAVLFAPDGSVLNTVKEIGSGNVSGLKSIGDIVSTIWAEEGGSLLNNNDQWSFGNGAVGTTRLYALYNGRIDKMFLQCESPGTTATIDLLINEIVTATGIFNSNGIYEFPSSVNISEGDTIGFRTNTVTGAWLDCRVGVGLIQTIEGLRGTKGDKGDNGTNGGATDQNNTNFICDFTSVSSSGQIFPSNLSGVLLANDGAGGVLRPKPTGVFSYDNNNFWFDVSNLFSSGATSCSVQFRVKMIPLAGNGFFDVEVVAYTDRNDLANSVAFSNSNGLVRATPNNGLPANPSPIFNITASENIDVLRVFTYSQANNEQIELSLFQVDYKLFF